MKTVKDYLDFGLVFVDDDMIQAVTGEPSYGSTSLARCLFKCGEYPSGIKLVGSMCGMGEWIPSLFAWRNNDGVKPEYKGDKEIELRNGKAELTSKLNAFDNEDWSILGAPSDIVKWRPVVLQSESATALPKEDKPMRPVYTAEMHAKKELPPVDSKAKVCIEEAGFELEGSDPKYEGKVVTVKAAFVNKDGEKLVAIENDKGNCACYIIECIKPVIKTIKVNGFDVPAPMSENIKAGDKYFSPAPASERYFQHTYWDGGDFDKLNLARGTIHKTQDAAIAHAKAMLGIDPSA